MNEGLHLLIDAAGWVAVAVSVILYISSNKRQAKKENEQRHEENKERLDELLYEKKYLPLHGHVEKDGPLQAKGIIRKPNGHG